MSEITVYSTNDGLKAYLMVPEAYKGFYPDCDILKKYLNDRGVVYGIRDEALRDMVAGAACGRRVLVAQGLPADPGVDGRLEVLIDISGVGRPKEFADGSVDHKDLKKIINVRKEDPLLRRIPPKAGKDGYTIFGKVIPAAPPKDIVLLAGEGTMVSRDDPDLLLAAHNGAVTINDTGDIEVRTAKVVTGDIDYSTGNISFSGDLKVQGSVRAGFSVQAHGNLSIGGNVEDAAISCAGNLDIAGGAVGSGNGTINCGGTLKAHHIENFTVTACGAIKVSDTILHSTCKTNDVLEAKTVVGGRIEAAGGVRVDTIGAHAETKTVIKAGSAYLLLQEKKLFQEKTAELTAEKSAANKEMYFLVRDGMDKNGDLSGEDAGKLDMVKEKKRKLIGHISELTAKIKEIDAHLQRMPNPVITARTIFPVTMIRFGLNEKIIKEKMYNTVLSADDKKIIVQKQ